MRKIAFFIFLIHFLIQLATLSHYGLNWDEVRRNYRSQAYLHYFLTGKKDYSDLSQLRQSLYQKSPQGLTFSYFASENIIGHPPVGDLLEAFGNFIFYQKLGIMSDTNSYHLFIIFISSVLVASVFLFTGSEYGLFSGFIAAIALSLYPLFTGESHFNFKDPLEAAFFTFTLLTFYKGIVKNNWRWIVGSAVFAGLALGTKFNILFAGPIAIFWLIVYFWDRLKSLKWPFSRQTTISFIFYPLITLGILYAPWPYLWQHPITNLINTFKYYAFWGYGYRFQPDSYFVLGGFNTYPLQWILFTTPLTTLFLAAFGIIYTFKNGIREKNKTAMLILTWFMVTLVRVVAPQMGTTNGVRELFEYIPAVAILSGIGASYVVKLLNGYIVRLKQFNNLAIKPLFLLQFIAILSFIPITLKLISIHPNENVYFNSLIGGLKGAKEKNIYGWGNDFGNTYRQAANWIDKNVPRNAKVDLAIGGEGNIPRVWLRKDIFFSNTLRRDISPKGEYIIERSGDNSVWPHYCYWEYAKNFLNPVYRIEVDGVPILTIWKNDREHMKNMNKLSSILSTCIQRDRQDSDS